jgi:hypothetical protein
MASLCHLAVGAPQLESLALPNISGYLQVRTEFPNLVNLYVTDPTPWLLATISAPRLDRLYVSDVSSLADYSAPNRYQTLHIPTIVHHTYDRVYNTFIQTSSSHYRFAQPSASHITPVADEHGCDKTFTAYVNKTQIKLVEVQPGILTPSPVWYAQLGVQHPTLMWLGLDRLEHVTSATLRVICAATNSTPLLWIVAPPRHGRTRVSHFHVPTLRAFFFFKRSSLPSHVSWSCGN